LLQHRLLPRPILRLVGGQGDGAVDDQHVAVGGIASQIERAAKGEVLAADVQDAAAVALGDGEVSVFKNS
jgi:hypothetical protein